MKYKIYSIDPTGTNEEVSVHIRATSATRASEMVREINDLLATVPEKLKKEREPVGECSFCGDYIWDGIKHICEPPKKEEKKIEKINIAKESIEREMEIAKGSPVDVCVVDQTEKVIQDKFNQIIDLLNSHHLEIERLKERK